MSSRFCSDCITSMGFRLGSKTCNLTSKLFMASKYKDVNLQIRGSLMTMVSLPLYSASIMSAIESTSALRFREPIEGCKRRQSFQLDPSPFSIASWASIIARLSQCPRALPSLAPSKVIGRSAPSRFNTRVMADVPLRCMPKIRITFLIIIRV